jgi:purine catabolism regulator
MGNTIQCICEKTGFMNSCRLVAGEGGLNKSVRSISVMEVEDFASFVNEENLFILTTFSFAKRDPVIMFNTFKELADRSICGICIKINRYVDAIPQEILTLANERNIPVFETDEHILFSQLILMVTTQLINAQYDTINALNQQYELMNGALLRGEHIRFFIHYIGKQLKANCHCFSNDGRQIGQYLNHQSTNMNYFYKIITSMNDVIANAGQPIIDDYYSDENNYYYIFPCITNNNIIGYFIVEKMASFTERDVLLLKQVNNYITIKLIENSIIETESASAKIYMINRIFYDNAISKSQINEYIKIVGIEQKKNFVILLLEADEKLDSMKLFFIKKRILNFFVKHSVNEILIEDIYEGLAILVFFENEKCLNANFNQTLIALNSLLNQDTKLFKLGSSQKNSDVLQIAAALKEAKEALMIGKSFYPQDDIYMFNQFIQVKMFIKMLDTKEYAVLKQRLIRPLVKYDEHHNATLIQTLNTCINSMTLNEAADKLFIHINSLRYRLDKIKAMTGEDFFNNIGKQTLSNAMMLYRLENLFDQETRKKLHDA